MEYTKIDGVQNPLSRLIFGTAIPRMYGGEDASEVQTPLLARVSPPSILQGVMAGAKCPWAAG